MAATTPDPSAVRTEPVPVTVRLTSGVEVTGNVHVRPNSYQTRVSDLLNRGATEFLPLTDATMVRPDGGTTMTDCVIVRLAQIDCVVCIGQPRSTDDEVEVEYDEVPVDTDDDQPGEAPVVEMAATAVW